MSNGKKYAGLDVSTVALVLNAQGKCVMGSIIETKDSTVVDFIFNSSS